MVSYEQLWKTMEQQSISTYTLIHKFGINPRTVNNLKHNRGITVDTLEKLCVILNCTPNEVIEFKPDSE